MFITRDQGIILQVLIFFILIFFLLFFGVCYLICQTVDWGMYYGSLFLVCEGWDSMEKNQ